MGLCLLPPRGQQHVLIFSGAPPSIALTKFKWMEMNCGVKGDFHDHLINLGYFYWDIHLNPRLSSAPSSSINKIDFQMSSCLSWCTCWHWLLCPFCGNLFKWKWIKINLRSKLLPIRVHALSALTARPAIIGPRVGLLKHTGRAGWTDPCVPEEKQGQIFDLPFSFLCLHLNEICCWLHGSKIPLSISMHPRTKGRSYVWSNLLR